MATEADKHRAIRPTLFIGLGGTGKEVLLRLRRRFYERWRKVGLPCVKYLWIDTDTRDVLARGEKLDEIDNLLLFGEAEKVGLLKGNVGADLGDILNNPLRYDYIHEWLPEEVKIYGTQVADGAGGVRSIGRLTLVNHFPEVRGIIREHLESLRSDAAIKETHEKYLADEEVDFDPNPQVYVIFSVAGGTGGGTFLDVAFLLQEMKHSDTAGIAVLPNVYYSTNSGPEGKRSLANAYGALKEIEHFTRHLQQAAGVDSTRVSRDLEVQWDRGIPLSIPGPPFSVLYLCEKIDDQNVPVANRHQLFHTIAESLFMNFLPGQFSSAKRSGMANVRGSLAELKDDQVAIPGTETFGRIKLNQAYSRRFGSMGVAKIEVPTDSIREACAANLAAEIVSYWNRPIRDMNLRARVDADALRNFDADGIEDLFGKEYESEIAKKKEELLPPMMMFSASSSQVASFLTELPAKLTEAHDNLFADAGDNPEAWGRVKQLLHHFSVSKAPELINEKFDKWVRKSLEAESLGLAAMVEDTKDVKGMIPLLRRDLSAIYETEACIAAKRAEEAEKEAGYWADEQMRFSQEMVHVHSTMTIRMLGVRTWTLNRLWDKLRDAVEQHWKWRGAAILAKEARIVAEQAEHELKILFGKLTDFRNKLPDRETHLRALQMEYLDFDKGVRSVKVFDPNEDYKKFYRLGYDPQKKEHRAVDVPAENSKFIQEKILRGGGETMDVVDFQSKKGMDTLFEQLRDYATTRFRNDFNSCSTHECLRMVEVLKHPKVGEVEKVARQLVAYAAPMLYLRLAQDGGYCQAKAYLSVPTNEGDEYKTFIQEVKDNCRARGYGDPDISITGDRTKIQLFVEKYAFSLNSVPLIVGDCHNEYYSFYQLKSEGSAQLHSIPLHIHKQWEGEFDDLRQLKDEKTTSLIEAIEILSVGPVLGVIKAQINNGRRQYSYSKYVYPTSLSQILGNKRQAVEFLSREQFVRETLLQEVRGRHEEKVRMARSEKEDEKQQAIAYLWALAYLRFAVLTAGSPEFAIVDARSSQITSVFDAEPAAVQDPARVAEIAREKLGDRVNWQGGFPMLDPPYIFGKPRSTGQAQT